MNKNFFNNKVILITGGTGSFGQKFTEVLLKEYNPKKIIIFSRDELKQFEMANAFSPGSGTSIHDEYRIILKGQATLNTF